MIPIFGNSLKLVFLLGSLLPTHVAKPDPVGSDHAPVPSPLAMSRPAYRSPAVLLPAKHPTSNPARLPAYADRANPDPIRFSMQCDKRQIAVNEEVSLTVTVQLLTVSAAQLVFVPGSNDYTLRMLLPPGFEQTGGDFTDYVAGTLSAASTPVMTYHIRGYFRFMTPGTSFRLLRSHGQANDQSQFVEKSIITLRVPSAEPSGSQLRKGGTKPANPAETTLYVTSENAVAGAARAAAPEYRGFIDYADCDAISGWIVDRNNLRKSQSIDVYINGVKAATVLADQRRLDVAKTLGVDDFSDYGYVWIIPKYYKTNAPLTVSVRPADTSTELTLSPYQTATCPGTGPPTTTTPPATVTTTPPVTTTTGGALTVLAPTYNCTTGAITFNTSGGDGTPVRFRSVGITDWTTNPNQYLDVGSRVSADTPPFVIYTEQSGRMITYTWSRQATCGGTTPPAEPTPTPTPTITPLTALAPTYNCTTGAITFRTSGGDGSPVRFRATGITAWTTNPNQYLDAGSRVSADTPPFTLYFEQSGRTITYNWSRQATCGGTAPPAEPAPNPATTPAAGGACATSISTVSYAWDGGNSSISLRINASAGAPQIKLSGNTNIDWTNTSKLESSGWFWANQGMNTGPYTLSVRPSGDGGAGCSFSFVVPSPGKQLYPATGGGEVNPGCNPPSAPTLSAPNGTQVCNNSAVTLTAAGCSGTVTWSGGQSGASIGVSAAGTYSATCTLNGCTSGPSNQLMVTACAPTNNGRYNRVLYVGNSITLHGGSQFFIVNDQNSKRGMAATSPDKDYVRLLSAKHREQNASVDNRTFASWDLGGQLDEATGPYWEGNSTKNNIDLSRFDPVAAWKPDLVYIRLGENVADGEITNPSQYQNRLKALIDKLISQSPGAKVVLSTSVWDRPNYDAAIRAVGAERNYPIANFSSMWPNRLINGYYALNPGIYGDPGVNNHPDDDGMAHIADKLWEATPK